MRTRSLIAVKLIAITLLQKEKPPLDAGLRFERCLASELLVLRAFFAALLVFEKDELRPIFQ
jgi:hypothetical protein